MKSNIGKKPLYRAKKFTEQTLAIRNKMLLWRFNNYYRLRALIEEKLESPGISDEIYGEDAQKNLSSRTRQILLPLSLVMSKRAKLDLVRLAEGVPLLWHALRRLGAQDERTVLDDAMHLGLRVVLEAAASILPGQGHDKFSLRSCSRPMRTVSEWTILWGIFRQGLSFRGTGELR